MKTVYKFLTVKIHEHSDVVVILVLYGKKWQWPTEKKMEKKSLEGKNGKDLEAKRRVCSRIVPLRSQ